jgi:hypothetical protein
LSALDDSVEGIRARYDLVEGLEIGPFSRIGYQRMLGQSGGVVRRPFYGHGILHIPPFAIALPEARLLDAIGCKQAEGSLVEEAGTVYTYSGMAARDGSESHALARVDYIFEEYSDPPRPGAEPPRPMNFMLYMDIRVGQPIGGTFRQSSPPDRSRQRYWASLQVVWAKVWSFFIAPTLAFAIELRERVRAGHGFDIGPPPYTVNR